MAPFIKTKQDNKTKRKRKQKIKERTNEIITTCGSQIIST